VRAASPVALAPLTGSRANGDPQRRDERARSSHAVQAHPGAPICARVK